MSLPDLPEVFRPLILAESRAEISSGKMLETEKDSLEEHVGVHNGVARELSGRITIDYGQDGVSIESTRIPFTQVSHLGAVVLGSGIANIKLESGLRPVALGVDRISGRTKVLCGDDTAVIIGSHSGPNELVEFVDRGMHIAPNGDKYTVIVPSTQEKSGTSWVRNIIRIDQCSGIVNVSKGQTQLLKARGDKRAISGIGRRSLAVEH